MKEVLLAAGVRHEIGKGSSRKLRRSGSVPGIVYGKGKANTPIAINNKELLKILGEGTSGKIIRLELAAGPQGDHKTVMIRDVQRDFLGGDVLHVDLQEISLTEEFTVKVPVVLEGEDRRKSDGGILQHLLWELEVHALPTAIPDRIEVNVSGFGIGDAVHVSDLRLGSGIKVLTPAEEVIVSVVAPAKPEEEEAKEDVREPEVVGKEHKEGEE